MRPEQTDQGRLRTASRTGQRPQIAALGKVGAQTAKNRCQSRGQSAGAPTLRGLRQFGDKQHRHRTGLIGIDIFLGPAIDNPFAEGAQARMGTEIARNQPLQAWPARIAPHRTFMETVTPDMRNLQFRFCRRIMVWTDMDAANQERMAAIRTILDTMPPWHENPVIGLKSTVTAVDDHRSTALPHPEEHAAADTRVLLLLPRCELEMIGQQDDRRRHDDILDVIGKDKS